MTVQPTIETVAIRANWERIIIGTKLKVRKGVMVAIVRDCRGDSGFNATWRPIPGNYRAVPCVSRKVSELVSAGCSQWPALTRAVNRAQNKKANRIQPVSFGFRLGSILLPALSAGNEARTVRCPLVEVQSISCSTQFFPSNQQADHGQVCHHNQ